MSTIIIFLSKIDIKSMDTSKFFQNTEKPFFFYEDAVPLSGELEKIAKNYSSYKQGTSEEILNRVLVLVKQAQKRGFSKKGVILQNYVDPVKINLSLSKGKINYDYKRIEGQKSSFCFKF